MANTKLSICIEQQSVNVTLSLPFNRQYFLNANTVLSLNFAYSTTFLDFQFASYSLS